MLFDTVEFLSATSKLVNPVIESTVAATPESSVAKQYVDDGLVAKADKSNTYTKSESDARIQAIVGSAPAALDTLQEIAASLQSDEGVIVNLASKVSTLSFYDIGGFSSGKPDASSSLFKLISPRAFTLPSNLASSICKCGTAATGSTVFAIKKNGAQIGTMTFAASGTNATFAMSGSNSIAIGDILDVVAPATADATLADVVVTLVGTLPTA